MFASRYFAPRYFNPRYWAKSGDDLPLAGGSGGSGYSYFPLTRRRKFTPVGDGMRKNRNSRGNGRFGIGRFGNLPASGGGTSSIESPLFLNFEVPILDPRISFTRNTSAWYFNSSGVLTDAGSGNPRFDYDPSNPVAPRGLLLEMQRTNSIRNNTMAGVSAGSPGTTPTNWSVTSTGGVVTRTVVGSGISNGIEYVDIRYQFSASGTANIAFEQNTQVAAESGENWTTSVFVQLIGGSYSNVTTVVGVNELDGAGSFLTGSSTSVTATSAGLNTQRVSHTRTLNNGSTAYASPILFFSASAAADITIRIGLPQLELGLCASSVIKTSSAATTRNLDRFTIGTLTPWFNAAGGTIVARVALGLPANGETQTIASFSDNSTDNVISLHVISTGTPQFITASGGVYDGHASNGTILVADTFTTIAASYQSGRLEISQNGGAVTADTSFTFPSGMTRLDLLGNNTGAIAPTTARLKWLRYYPSAYTGAALQNLSSMT